MENIPQKENSPQNANTLRSKGVDEKFCESCGEVIKARAEICPKCGVRQKVPFDKTVLLLLTFFFGGLGVHKFYLGKIWQGIFYLLFCWTMVPSFIAFVEFWIYAFSTPESLGAKYPRITTSGGGALLMILAVVFGGIVMIGILSALAIPKMFGVSMKAKMAEAPGVIANWEALESAYAMEEKRAGSWEQIGFRDPSPTSRSFSYSVTLESPTHATMTAKAKRAIGTCPAGGMLTSIYNPEIDLYVHGGDPACRAYVPNF
ncbi:MAG: geopilin domain rane protein [Fibrobacteres bacterium]|nr:geopilin domain rane protein [Fibrobacterota bacterium]